jgi:hypothetical protein
MTKQLSPAAASIVQAFDDRYEINMFNVNWQEDCIAAALRAAADIVDDREASRQLDAIAYELEAQ